MKSNIFIPKQLHVGFVKRSDTYNGTLGFIIYTDQKGVKRQKKSWEKWRDKTIDTLDIDNEPIEGFVLNKNVGGVSGRHSWDNRTEKVRIYHPKGFEFEITIPNLLYILENTSAIKGKGLENAMILGWDGNSLVLIPEGAPEFEQMISFTELQSGKVSKKELVPGQIYITAQNEEIVYLKEAYSYNYSGVQTVKKLFFSTTKNRTWNKTFTKPIESLKADTGRAVTPEEFSSILDILEDNTTYSPIEWKKQQHVLVDHSYLLNCVKNSYHDSVFYKKRNVKIKETPSWEKDFKRFQIKTSMDSSGILVEQFDSIQEMIDTKLFTQKEYVDIGEYEYVKINPKSSPALDGYSYIKQGDKFVKVEVSREWKAGGYNNWYAFTRNEAKRFYDITKVSGSFDTFEELAANIDIYKKKLINLPKS